MELLDAFDRAREEFGNRVRQVRDDQWQATTPCSEWSVRDLVNHLVGEHLWAAPLLRGATLGEIGDRFDGDLLGNEPASAWEQAAAASYAAFHRPGALEGRVHTSGGPIPASEYGMQMTLDLTVHAWDLARGIGASDRIDTALVALVYGYVEPRVHDWQNVGIFGPPVEVSNGADRQDRLVALLGRVP